MFPQENTKTFFRAAIFSYSPNAEKYENYMNKARLQAHDIVSFLAY